MPRDIRKLVAQIHCLDLGKSWIGKAISSSASRMKILSRTEWMKISRALFYFFANADGHKSRWKTDPKLCGYWW